MVNSKRKGNSFERQVAKKLNEMYKGVIDGEFKRAPSSGAYLGGKNKEKNKNLSYEAKRTLTSDIIVPKNWKYAIECKAYKKIDLYGLIVGNKSVIYDWIDEVENTVGDEFDGWIIIAKQNRSKWIVIIKESNLWTSGVTNLIFEYKGQNYRILDFEEYFKEHFSMFYREIN